MFKCFNIIFNNKSEVNSVYCNITKTENTFAKLKNALSFRQSYY